MQQHFYSLNNITSQPIYGLFISLFLIIGISVIGFFISQKISLYKKSCGIPLWQQWLISPTLGISFIGAFLYPLILFGSQAGVTLAVLAYLLLGIGIASSLALLLKLFNNPLPPLITSYTNLYNCAAKTLFLILLIAYALLSLSPPTDIDALDYHIGVPLRILNTGTWIFSPEWFTGRLAGLGEVFIALGLVVGAEQFGSLLEYCGLLSIVACISQPNPNSKSSNSNSHYLAISYIASPVMLWLVSTAKPLLLPISMTTIALFFLTNIEHSKKIIVQQSTKNDKLFTFLVTLLLISCASLMKLNFLLSAGLVGIIVLMQMKKFCMPKSSYIFGACIVLLALGPPAIWKSIHYGGNLIDSIYNPMPGNWPGTNNFINYLRNYTESNIPFPVSIFIAIDPGKITTIVGAGAFIGIAFLIAGLRKISISSVNFLILIASISLIILGSTLGQTGGRFYLEPLAWIFLAIRSQGVTINSNLFKISILVIWVQALAVLAGAIFCIWLFLPGSIFANSRFEVLNRFACQFTEIQWVNQMLPRDAVLLTDFRNKSFLNHPIVSLDWTYYLTNEFISPSLDSLLSSSAKPYLNLIKSRKATHILLAENPEYGPWKHCLGNKLGSFEAQFAARNPFNAGAKYTVWLYEFNSQHLPTCLIKK